ncbi:hypothetical protein [Acidocella sp.]|uniref:hypothetical protein n=1 Tax=Acidocella sp. TaxID=50710 RepID=UPI00262AED00|nr:hypothetical protein [Acidocella sp.]
MRKYFGLAALLALFAAPPALAGPCFMSQVRDSSGAILTITAGYVYRVYPGRYTVAAETWLPLQRLLVCHYGGSVDRITNLSLRHKVTILAVRNMP